MNQPRPLASGFGPALGEPRTVHLIVFVFMHIQQPYSKHHCRKDVEHGECDGFAIGVDAPRAHPKREDDGVHNPHDDSVYGELGVEPGRLGMLVLRAWTCTMSVRRGNEGVPWWTWMRPTFPALQEQLVEYVEQEQAAERVPPPLGAALNTRLSTRVCAHDRTYPYG